VPCLSSNSKRTVLGETQVVACGDWLRTSIPFGSWRRLVPRLQSTVRYAELSLLKQSNLGSKVEALNWITFSNPTHLLRFMNRSTSSSQNSALFGNWPNCIYEPGQGNNSHHRIRKMTCHLSPMLVAKPKMRFGC
jgi:hypothetical protein